MTDQIAPKNSSGKLLPAPQDIPSSIVVFLVALPLCLGIGLASVPAVSDSFTAEMQEAMRSQLMIAGLLTGIIGGILVAALSGSHTSVSGPAAGLTAVVAAQIGALGSYEAFLAAVVLAGVMQVVMGCLKAGALAAFFPSSVIKGLLAAIGVILILKQLPHLVGHDAVPEGHSGFSQPDQENTFTELWRTIEDFHPGAAVVGLASVLLLFLWGRWKPLKNSLVPAPLIVVLFGVGASYVFDKIGGHWAIEVSHLVEIPVTNGLAGVKEQLMHPDFSVLNESAVYIAALTVAAVASLETLLNLEAVDKIDPLQRISPPSRELVAQGIGNICVGFVGGLPMTSVIVRSSANINAGGKTKYSAIFHGILLAVSVLFFPEWLNKIPLACLAAILFVTGLKLASPQVMRQMWTKGPYQFIPFIVTVIAIVFTDLLIGVLIGLAISLGFILRSNFQRPLRRIVERHLGGDVVRIELANQVSFLNRAALDRELNSMPPGSQIMLDAQGTDYIDPDLLDLIRDFKEKTAPVRGVKVSLKGFRARYQIEDQTQYVDYSTRELQSSATPAQVLQILKDGHQRFLQGKQLKRDLGLQVNATAAGQHPLAVILACIDSRTPAELIFDLGMGDIFSVRVAGNVTSPKVLGSLEFGTALAGAKLILVMGHTRCGAVTAAVKGQSPAAVECRHLQPIVAEIQRSMPTADSSAGSDFSGDITDDHVNEVARRNVLNTMRVILSESETVARLVNSGEIALMGAMYDVVTGDIEFLETPDPAEPGGQKEGGPSEFCD